MLQNTSGANTEIVGGFSWTGSSRPPDPAILNIDSRVAAAYVEDVSTKDASFSVELDTTVAGERIVVPSTSFPQRGQYPSALVASISTDALDTISFPANPALPLNMQRRR
jgi:hypothetical protein